MHARRVPVCFASLQLTQWQSAFRADQEIPGPANRDPDSRFPAESGNGGFPRFPIPAESGIGEGNLPSPIPGQMGNRGNGNWGFPGLLSGFRVEFEFDIQKNSWH